MTVDDEKHQNGGVGEEQDDRVDVTNMERVNDESQVGLQINWQLSQMRDKWHVALAEANDESLVTSCLEAIEQQPSVLAIPLIEQPFADWPRTDWAATHVMQSSVSDT